MTAPVRASRLRMTAIALLVAGAAAHLSVPVLFGRPRPQLTIVWSGVAPEERAGLERRFGLADLGPAGGHARHYAAYDTSPATLRALADDARVASVGGLDRARFAIARDAPLTPRRDGLLAVPRAVSGLARRVALALLALGAILLALSTRRGGALASAAGTHAGTARRDPAGAIRALAAGVGRALNRSVPAASAEAAAAFRIAFGAGVLLWIASEPVYPELLTPYELSAAEGPYGLVVRALAARPALVYAINPFVLVTGALFVIGAMTRLTYAAFVLGVLLWACVFTLNTTAHTVGSLQLAMLALLPARWGDAWSADAWLRARRGSSRAPAAGPVYGYTFWAPMLVLGVAFLAAALSKTGGGLQWIANGTVKYHFISDHEQAWTGWGLVLGRYHWVAVAMSAYAVVVEALLITAVFSTRGWYRALLAIASLALLLGFALFQGIVWPAWWMLLAAFLPWGRIARRPGGGREGSLTAAQAAAVALIVAQQLVASAAAIEARPLLSAYDMYSATYDSPDDYEAASNLEYRIVAGSGGAWADVPGCVVSDRAAEIARLASAGSAPHQAMLRDLVGPCLRDRPDVERIRLEGDRQVFDWTSSRFEWKRRLDVIGPLDAAPLR
jgi:hypothetical protein